MRVIPCQPEQFLQGGLALSIKGVHLVTETNPSANEWFDDGRGDSPRLRPIDSPPRPSTETLAADKTVDSVRLVKLKRLGFPLLTNGGGFAQFSVIGGCPTFTVR